MDANTRCLVAKKALLYKPESPVPATKSTGSAWGLKREFHSFK